MEIINKPIDLLIPYAKNARVHDDAQIAQLAGSIKEFGFNNPILIDKDNGIIAGHGRVMAARKLGLTEVPTILLDHLNETQRKAYILADNRIAINSTWDNEMLSLELMDIKDDVSLAMLGFSVDELDALLNPTQLTDGLTDEDAVPDVPIEPTTKLGDIYQLGNHRLMCGDSTSIDAVEKLMDGQKADMVFTDPPYNVSVKGKFTGIIKNDNLNDDDFNSLLQGVVSNISLVNKGSIYVCYEIKNHNQFESKFNQLGNVDEIIIWNKDSASFYSNDKYNRKYEAILFIQGDGQLNCKAETNVWDYAKSSSFNSRDENNKRFNEKGNFLVAHPTTKPVKLVERAISNSSKKQDIILDLFGGSGSTMIAAEKVGRHSRLMELDPKYCDVIIKRWEEFTGKKAVLL
jgi:DNA modification methylase